MGKKVAVVISYHQLCTYTGKSIPRPGETLMADSFYMSGGGKGMNQAYAAKLTGCEVHALGRVGDDTPGHLAKSQLHKVGIDSSGIAFDPDQPTGQGAIFKDAEGQNCIEIFTAASNFYSTADFDAQEEYIRQCGIVGFQYEVNTETVAYGIKRARELGAETFLDPAPVPEKLPDKTLYQYLTYIKPNEFEATRLTGIDVVDYQSAVSAGKFFLDMGVEKAAVITLGGQGAVLVTHEGSGIFPCAKVDFIHTAGAGDAFAGGFLGGMAQTGDVIQGMICGTAMAGMIVSRVGSIHRDPEACLASYKRIKKEYSEYLNHAPVTMNKV